MTDTLLLYGAPDASPDLFHAIPAGIVDPFLYVETNGRRAATVSVLDADKVEPMGIEIVDIYELGADDLFGQGLARYEIDLELARRACERLGVRRALVPPQFRSASPTTCGPGASSSWSTRRRSSTSGA
jgi:Xaa-Pro aminopeptidase